MNPLFKIVTGLLAVKQGLEEGVIHIESRIPEGTDIESVILGTDLEKAFAYGISGGGGPKKEAVAASGNGGGLGTKGESE